METEGINTHKVTKECCDCKSCKSLERFISSITGGKENIMEKIKENVDSGNYEEEQVSFFGEDDE